MKLILVFVVCLACMNIAMATEQTTVAESESMVDLFLFGEYLASGFIITSPYQDMFFWTAYYHESRQIIELSFGWPLDPSQEAELTDFAVSNSLGWQCHTLAIANEYTSVLSFTCQTDQDPAESLIFNLAQIVDLSFIYELDINY